jgi:uncharacterized protein YecT (DUF1311 family)
LKKLPIEGPVRSRHSWGMTKHPTLATASAAVLAALLLAAAPAQAANPPVPYERFELSDAAYEAMTSTQYMDCLDASGGVTISMRDCAGDEHERLDVRLNAAYRAAMARLAGSADRNRLQRLERRWLATRWDSCRRENAEETGTLGLILLDGCNLGEMQRRIAWLERYGR